MNCCSRFPLVRMSCSTSRWRSLSGPSFSLCSNSTYPFKIDSGVFKSCAALASALVVRWKRSRNSVYSCNRFSGLGTSSARAGLDVLGGVEAAPGAFGAYVFFWAVAMKENHRGREIPLNRSRPSGSIKIVLQLQ